MDSNVFGSQGWVFLAQSGESGFDLALKLVSGIASLVALAFAIYVVFLKRKWKRDKELEKEKEEKKQLQYEGMITTLKTELEPRIQSTAQMMGTVLERLTKVEDAQNSPVDNSNLHTFKYNVDNDISELKREFSLFKNSCAKRHDKIASLGSLTDLKARVSELAQKIDRLEDFRHKSADRYVLMANYQQDTRMITDAIGALREDLRAVIDMVDKL
jgi:hypothetical protein